MGARAALMALCSVATPATACSAGSMVFGVRRHRPEPPMAARGRWQVLVALGSAGVLVAGCGSAGAPSAPTSAVAAPLPTTAGTTDLLCGFVSRASVVEALGRSDLTVHGTLTRAARSNADGTTLQRATCAVSLPGDGTVPALDVEVVPLVGDAGAGIVRGAAVDSNATYPAGVGTGFANDLGYRDPGGRLSAVSGLLRGDWKITLGIQLPAAGRDAVSDVMALAQEVVDELHLPLEPSTPYPDAYPSDVSPSASPTG